MSGWDWVKEGAGAAESNTDGAGPAVLAVPRIEKGGDAWWRGSSTSTVVDPMPVILLGEEMPAQLTVEYLAATYADKVVPLEINSPKQTSVRLADWLLFTKGNPNNKHYLRNL